MRVGHCQLACTGTFAGNFEKFYRGLEWAEQEWVEIVSFPECFLTGYWGDEAGSRREAFGVGSARMGEILEKTKHFSPTYIVGFNEVRGADLYNTAMVVERGKLLGTYSKCSAYMPFHKQGRAFPVFERGTLKFGVIICSDGGYIEPARILALKGARVIFAPHYNYIRGQDVVYHFMRTRADHVARAVENCVYFVRGNSVSLGQDVGHDYEGAGMGDSYVLDYNGEMVARTRRQREDYLLAEVEEEVSDRGWGKGNSLWSLRELGEELMRLK